MLLDLLDAVVVYGAEVVDLVCFRFVLEDSLEGSGDFVVRENRTLEALEVFGEDTFGSSSFS